MKGNFQKARDELADWVSQHPDMLENDKRKEVVCDTDTFWKHMCGIEFVRISRHLGARRDTLYFVDVPPEEIPGYIENIQLSIVSNLNLKMPRKHWYSLKRLPLPWAKG